MISLLMAILSPPNLTLLMKVLTHHPLWCWLFLFFGLALESQGQSYLQQRRLEANSATISARDRMEALHWLSDYHRSLYEADSCMVYAERYAEEANKSADRYHQVSSLVQMGDAFRMSRKPKEANTQYELAARLNQQTTPYTDLENEIIRGMGHCRVMQQDVDSAKTFYLKGLALAKKIENPYYQVANLWSLSSTVFTWLDVKDTTQFLAYLNQALEVDPKGDQDALIQLARLASRLGSYYSSVKLDSLSHHYLNLASSYLDQITSPAFSFNKLGIYETLVSRYKSLARYQEAIKVYEKILTIAPWYDDVKSKAEALYVLGQLHGSDYLRSN